MRVLDTLERSAGQACKSYAPALLLQRLPGPLDAIAVMFEFGHGLNGMFVAALGL